MMKEAGHTNTTLYELGGFNHGQMAEPAHPLLLRFMREHPVAPGGRGKRHATRQRSSPVNHVTGFRINVLSLPGLL